MFFLYITLTIKSDNNSDNKYSDNKTDIIRPKVWQSPPHTVEANGSTEVVDVT